MATDHTETVRQILVAAGYDADTIFTAPFREGNPAKAVSILSAPGASAEALLNGGSSALNQDGVQVLVRGEHDGYGECKARALAIHDAIRFQKPQGYVGIWPQGKPAPIGEDGEGRPLWSINFICRIIE